jgi:glycosyltransferase involved in cell wall biosynthesis
MSLVSVIIPCYKYAHFLGDCVQSALNQQGVDVRVLILDDASPDNTPEVAAQLMAQDARVAYRRHASNQGHIATYNEGLQWACGDYTVLISADDLLIPGSLRRAAQLMDAHPEVGFTYGNALKFQTDQPLPMPRSESEATGWQIQTGMEWLEARCRDGDNCIFSPEVVTRTKLQHQVGGYRPELPHTGDLEMWMRFAARSQVGILDADQAWYRIHPRNMHKQYSLRMTSLQTRKATFDLFFQMEGKNLPERQCLQNLANRSLACDALWMACLAFDNRDSACVSVAELMAFAAQCYPESSSLPEYAGLRRRRRVGPRLWPWLHRLSGRQQSAAL